MHENAPSKPKETSLSDRIHLIRDEVRLHLHLANMDAKQSLSGFEAHLAHARHSAVERTEAAVHLVDDTRENARGAWEDLRVRFDLFMESLKRASGH